MSFTCKKISINIEISSIVPQIPSIVMFLIQNPIKNHALLFFNITSLSFNLERIPVFFDYVS